MTLLVVFPLLCCHSQLRGKKKQTNKQTEFYPYDCQITAEQESREGKGKERPHDTSGTGCPQASLYLHCLVSGGVKALGMRLEHR